MQNPWLLIAICTNRDADAIGQTLDSVAPQLRATGEAAGLLVANGVDAAAHERLEARAQAAGFEVDRLAEAGVAEARNRAVQHAGAERIVAFVDDDVIAAPDWLSSLLAHWRSAAADVAVIGGPIEPRFGVPPPRWMSSRLDVVFSVLDRGKGIKPLRPGKEDAWCANASFRASSLLEAGGFDPAYGPRSGHLRFGEDTEVQLRLAAAGYRGIYAGDVRVEHLIDPRRLRLREVLRRRFYAGVNMWMTGQWSAFDGAARLLGGAAETLIAAILRRDAAMAEGIARLGAGAGVLAAPVVRRRGPR